MTTTIILFLMGYNLKIVILVGDERVNLWWVDKNLVGREFFLGRRRGEWVNEQKRGTYDFWYDF